MNEELIEHPVNFTISPETYDYEDGDIVYRIILRTLSGDQLLIERAMPKLPVNGALKEIFILQKIADSCQFCIYACGNHKIKINSCQIGDFSIEKNLDLYSFRKIKTSYGLIEICPNIK